MARGFGPTRRLLSHLLGLHPLHAVVIESVSTIRIHRSAAPAERRLSRFETKSESVVVGSDAAHRRRLDRGLVESQRRRGVVKSSRVIAGWSMRVVRQLT